MSDVMMGLEGHPVGHVRAFALLKSIYVGTGQMCVTQCS